jgi:hypothetical protein
VSQWACLRLCHKYVKTQSCLFMTVLDSAEDDLPTQFRKQIKTHIATSGLHVFSWLVHKFFNNNTFTKLISKCFQILPSYINISTLSTVNLIYPAAELFATNNSKITSIIKRIKKNSRIYFYFWPWVGYTSEDGWILDDDKLHDLHCSKYFSVDQITIWYIIWAL